jgi:hypothetical protein
VRPIVGTGATRGYEHVLEDVRRELRPTLRALERAAAAPDDLDAAAADLPALQYALHMAGERVLGLEPMPGLEEARDELAVALAIAREETADVLEAVENEDPAADALVWEWRAALFGVRLALEHADASHPAEAPSRPLLRDLAPVVLLLSGVLVVLGGALADLWPVWVGGLVLVALSTGLSRRLLPRP